MTYMNSDDEHTLFALNMTYAVGLVLNLSSSCI